MPPNVKIGPVTLAPSSIVVAGSVSRSDIAVLTLPSAPVIEMLG